MGTAVQTLRRARMKLEGDVGLVGWSTSSWRRGAEALAGAGDPVRGGDAELLCWRAGSQLACDRP